MVSPDSLSGSMLQALDLERRHASIMGHPNADRSYERLICEAEIQKIGQLLTRDEQAQIRALQLRQQIRRLRLVDRPDSTLMSQHRAEAKQFKAMYADIDKEQLEEFLIMVEPETFKLHNPDGSIWTGSLLTTEIPFSSPIETAEIQAG